MPSIIDNLTIIDNECVLFSANNKKWHGATTSGKKYTKPDQDTNSPCLLLEANSKSVNECGGF